MIDQSASKFQKTNPAQRVLSFLIEFRQLRNEKTIRDALAKMYELEASDTSEIMRVVGDVWDLPLQLKEYIKQGKSAEDHPLNESVKKIEALLLTLNINGSVQQFLNNYPSDLISTLEAHTYYMNNDSNELISDKNQINSSIEKIDELIDQLSSLGYDQQFTMYCRDRLESVRYALRNIDLLGPKKIIEAVDALFGIAQREIAYNGRSANRKSKEFIHELMLVGNLILLGLNIANATYRLDENADKYILPVTPTVNQRVAADDKSQP